MEQSQSLKVRVLSAVGWATATRFFGQLVNWALTLATVRLLSPEDYGLAAVTMTTVGFISSMSSAGLIDAVVQNQNLDDERLRSIFGLVLAINGCCLVISCGLAYPAAWFYGEPRLVSLLQVSSLILVVTAFEAMPRASLDKRLDLKTVSRIEVITRITGGAVMLILASAGAGVWSLVTVPLLTGLLRAVGFGLATKNLQPPAFRLRGLEQIIRVGALRTLEHVLWYVITYSDIFILGKLLGADVLGVYWVSRNLASLPVQKFAVTVRPAVFPAFALIQHDRAEALQYLKKAIRLLAFLSCPVFFGLASIAPEIVDGVLGPKWLSATEPFAILAIAMALRPVGSIIPLFLMGLGEFAASLRNTLMATILFPAAYTIGSHWGMLGVCTAWLIAYPIQLLLLMRRAAIASGSTIENLVAPLISPITGSLIMYIVVRAAEEVLRNAFGLWQETMMLVIIGCFVYSMYTICFLRPVAIELTSLAKR